MHRFFVPPGALRAEPVVRGPDLAHHLGRVLRLRPGDRIVLLDNAGWEYEGELTRLARDSVEVRLLGKSPAKGEAATRIHLYQGLLKGQRFEWVLQKGTELGVASFTPLMCQRCVVGPPSPSAFGRWRRIVQEAAEQSGRGLLPPVGPAQPLAQALATAAGRRLLPWEGETGRSLRAALPRAGVGQPATLEVSLFIGPEGGWEEEEVALALSQGAISVGLGPRILRAETAGLVVAAAILFHRGELGG